MTASLKLSGGGSWVERVIKIGNRLFKIQCIGKPIRSRPFRGWGVEVYVTEKRDGGGSVI